MKTILGYAATGLLATGVFVGGYRHQNPDKAHSYACEAVNRDGERQTGVAYPLGEIAVKYQERRLIGNVVERAVGVVSVRGEDYVLRMPDLPDKLANDYLGYHKTDAYIALDVPGRGEIGLTELCMQPNESEIILPQ